MQAVREVLLSDVGLLSLGVIGVMLGMAVFFVRLFLGKIGTDAGSGRPR